MSRGGRWRWGIAVGLLGLLVGRGYAAEPLDAIPDAPPDEPPPAAAAPEPSRILRLKLADIPHLQEQALEEQASQEHSFITRENTVTTWMDRQHDRLFRWLDNTVRRVDMAWLGEKRTYDPELSTFRLSVLSRVGGRSSEKEFDLKVRFRGDFALPALAHRIHLFLDNVGRESLPGKDPMQQDSHTRLGIRAMLKTLKNSELSANGGLRWRDSRPVVYVGADWRYTRPVGDALFAFAPRVVYYTDDGFGQQAIMTWTRQISERKIFQVRIGERSAENMEGVEFEQSLRFAWLKSGRGRGWVAQASVFPHLESSDWYWDDSLVNVAWRDALYRKWIYYTIIPQIQFPKEDDYEPRPSLRIGLDILFGGRVSELLLH